MPQEKKRKRFRSSQKFDIMVPPRFDEDNNVICRWTRVGEAKVTKNGNIHLRLDLVLKPRPVLEPPSAKETGRPPKFKKPRGDNR